MISTLGHLISVDLGTLGVGTSRKTNAFADRSREFLQRAFCVAKNDESGSFRSNWGKFAAKNFTYCVLDDFGWFWMISDVEVTDLLQLRWKIHILDYDAGFPILGAS